MTPCNETAFAMPEALRGPAVLALAARPTADWLWHGYLAPGAVTLLTSQWKSGKTTLASVLLSRMGAGGRLADCDVAAGRVVVVTEEPADHWLRRHQQVGFDDHVEWYCRPFWGARPRFHQWTAFIDGLVQSHFQSRLPCSSSIPWPTSCPAARTKPAPCSTPSSPCSA
jgi:hypothetical protein